MPERTVTTIHATRDARRPRTVAVALAFALVLLAGFGAVHLTGCGRAADNGSPSTGTQESQPATGGPKHPGQSIPGPRPTDPVAEGATLGTISTPPPDTLAKIDAGKLAADAVYTVTFSPFGYGPPLGGRTLVMRIDDAQPENESARAMDMNGRNVLALIGPGVDITKGGTYTGTLTFQSQGNLLVAVIGDVKAR